MSVNNPSNPYTCVSTIALLPSIDEAAFENAMINEIMRRLPVSWRNIAELKLQHCLFKDEGSQRADHYVWQVRVGHFRLVSQPANLSARDVIIRAIDEEVREALAPWGIPVSMTVLQEIGRAETS
jgi:hypothetical protein